LADILAQLINAIGDVGGALGTIGGPPTSFETFWAEVSEYVSLTGRFTLAGTVGVNVSNITGVPTVDQVHTRERCPACGRWPVKESQSTGQNDNKCCALKHEEMTATIYVKNNPIESKPVLNHTLCATGEGPVHEPTLCAGG
jgi:hypothetical protein